ncbi:MAG: hypothetical protein ACREPF_05620, partial [Rhodanobacteraceae bacterium]
MSTLTIGGRGVTGGNLFTPQGIKRESEVAPNESITHSTARKLDFAIIRVMATVSDVELAHLAFDPARVPLTTAACDAAAGDFAQLRVAPSREALRGTAAVCGSLRLITRTAWTKLKRSGSSRSRPRHRPRRPRPGAFPPPLQGEGLFCRSSSDEKHLGHSGDAHGLIVGVTWTPAFQAPDTKNWIPGSSPVELAMPRNDKREIPARRLLAARELDSGFSPMKPAMPRNDSDRYPESTRLDTRGCVAATIWRYIAVMSSRRC